MRYCDEDMVTPLDDELIGEYVKRISAAIHGEDEDGAEND